MKNSPAKFKKNLRMFVGLLGKVLTKFWKKSKKILIKYCKIGNLYEVCRKTV